MPGPNDPNDTTYSQNPYWEWDPKYRRWAPNRATEGLNRFTFDFPMDIGLQAQSIPATTDGGAQLDVAQPEEDRSYMADILGQLQTQATTGGGAWEQALAQNTQTANSTAQALGQSATGTGAGYGASARAIGNAQGANSQRAVGQGNLLRAQTQQQAQGQIGDLLAGQGALDAQQAGQAAGANQGLLQANRGLEQNAAKERLKLVGGVGQAVTNGLSDGGRVPGEPEVMADSPVNDTVEAKSTDGGDLLLSPGEIVIPLSIAESPDAPRLAADFVAALKARGPQQQSSFAPGGEIPFEQVDANQTASLVKEKPNVLGVGPTTPEAPLTSQLAPSIGNGGLLDTANYDSTRSQSLKNAQHFADAYQGRGPSVAPQAFQNATDSTINNAMQSRAPVGAMVAGAAEQQQGAAGNAAGLVAGESQRGAEAFVQALQRQRAQDVALATAKQQAAWRNTMMNAGISLEQQSQLKDLLGGAGQGAMAASSMFDGEGEKPYHYDTGTGRYDTTPAWEDPGTASDESEWQQPFADGGVVAHLSRQGTRAKSKRPGAREKVNAWGDAVKTGAGDASEWKTYDKGTARSGGTQREADGPEQYFAEGGEVSTYERLRTLLAGSSASPIMFDGTGIPQSRPAGPFDAPLPEPRMMTPQQNAAADAMNAPKEAPLPHMPSQTRHVKFTPEMAKAPQTPPAAPAPIAPVTAPVRPMAAKPAAPDQFSLANQAGEEKAAAETQRADAETAALMEGQQALEANAIDQKERAARASASAQQQLGAIQQAREEMKRIDTTVDTGRLWKDRGIPGKIASVIGLVLGTLGNDNGVNRAATILNQQIDRDIDAQKSSFELALRKGQSNIDSAENLYSISRQAAQDDIAAGLAAKGSALDLVANKVALAASRAGSPMAKANLTALHAKVMADKDAADKAAHARLTDLGLKWYAAKTDRIAAERPSGANVMNANFVAPGYALAEGAHPKPEELAKWRDARAAADDIKTKATQLREMVSTGKLSGAGRFAGDEKAKAEALIGSLKVSAKNAYELGALSGSDMDLVMSQIANPVGIGGLFTGDKAMTTKLDQFIKNTDQTVTKKGDSLGIIKEGAKSGGGQDDAGARAWLADPKNADSPLRAKVQAKLEGR